MMILCACVTSLRIVTYTLIICMISLDSIIVSTRSLVVRYMNILVFDIFDANIIFFCLDYLDYGFDVVD